MERQKTTYPELMRALLLAGADPNTRIKSHPWYLVYSGCGNRNCGLDPAEIGRRLKGYQVDLPQRFVDTYRRRPVVIASVVVNDAMVDLTMRQPPPMSVDEQRSTRR